MASPAQFSIAFPVPWCRVRLVREAEPGPEAKQITRPADVAQLVRQRSDAEPVEVFYVVTLNAQNHPTSLFEVSRGLLSTSLVHPREVFQRAILANASSIIVAHNHPSGDPTPSRDDSAVTRQLVEAGRILDIPVTDHVIVAADAFFSFAEAGLI